MDLSCPFLRIPDQQKQVIQVSPERYLNAACAPVYLKQQVINYVIDTSRVSCYLGCVDTFQVSICIVHLVRCLAS